jgi:hypothetical protein
VSRTAGEGALAGTRRIILQAGWDAALRYRIMRDVLNLRDIYGRPPLTTKLERIVRRPATSRRRPLENASVALA